MRAILSFFKLPMQMVLGGYLAFMLIAVSVAIMEEHTEYEDDFPFCSDVEREARLEPFALIGVVVKEVPGEFGYGHGALKL